MEVRKHFEEPFAFAALATPQRPPGAAITRRPFLMLSSPGVLLNLNMRMRSRRPTADSCELPYD